MEIKTIIKGKIIIWNSRDEALLFFIQCSLSSEGSEKARYEKIIKQKDKQIEDLDNTLEFEIGLVNKYKSKLLKEQRKSDKI